MVRDIAFVCELDWQWMPMFHIAGYSHSWLFLTWSENNTKYNEWHALPIRYDYDTVLSLPLYCDIESEMISFESKWRNFMRKKRLKRFHATTRQWLWLTLRIILWDPLRVTHNHQYIYGMWGRIWDFMRKDARTKEFVTVGKRVQHSWVKCTASFVPHFASRRLYSLMRLIASIRILRICIESALVFILYKNNLYTKNFRWNYKERCRRVAGRFVAYFWNLSSLELARFIFSSSSIRRYLLPMTF